MFPDFLPIAAQTLTEDTSRFLARSLERRSVNGIATCLTHRLSAVSAEPSAPIVMLHGFDSSVFEFRRLISHLSAQLETQGQNRDLWAIDLLGFGFTDRTPVEVFDATAIKAHLYAVWQQEIRSPMVLVGASMGGAAAMDFAITYPEAVQQLVLLDAAGFAKGPLLAKFLIEPLGRWATDFLRQPKVRQQVSQRAYFDPAFVTPDAECCAALHLDMADWSRALISFTKNGGYSLGDRISQVSQPTQILWGRQDRILGTKDAMRFEKTIARAQLTWIENCGHVPHLESASETARVIVQGLV